MYNFLYGIVLLYLFNFLIRKNVPEYLIFSYKVFQIYSIFLYQVSHYKFNVIILYIKII